MFVVNDIGYLKLRAPWVGMKNAYVSSMLGSRKPKWIPFWWWVKFNKVMNKIYTLPVRLKLKMMGYNVIYPGDYQAALVKAFPFKDDEYCQDMLDFWLFVIRQDIRVVVAGWRADSSYGASIELAEAWHTQLPILNALGFPRRSH